MKTKVALLAVFILIEIVLLFYINYYYANKREEILNQNKQPVLKEYKTVIGTLKNLADNSFVGFVQSREDIKKAFASRDRKLLYNLLKENYRHLEKLGFKQVHFHLPSNHSFLRMHKPKRFGDDLTNIRYSVDYTNKHQVVTNGIETGRVLPGYRFVYPINYNGKHIGSVEFSFGIDKIVNDIEKTYDVYSHFLMEEDLFNSQVFKEYKNYYVQSVEHKNYIQLQRKRDLYKTNNIQYTKKQLEDIGENMEQLNTFIVEINSNQFTAQKKNFHKTATFLPIKNIKKDQTLYFVFYQNSEELKNIEEYRFNQSIMFASLILFIFIIVYMLLLRKIANDKLKIKLQNLLDAQDNMVILTDGKKLQFANKKFFDFLEYKDLDHFSKEHNCVCDLFLDHSDRFFHLGKIDKDADWIEEIQKLPHSQRVVMVMGPSFIIHSFSLTLNRYDDKSIVITFADISQTMLNQINLENKVVHDKLTNAYNREFFEENYRRLISDYHTQNSKLAIALLDIDHFKIVNDTYGHDVGDEVLIHFVETIHNNSRGDDILIRWGGEEFVFLLKVKFTEDLQKVLEHHREAIEMENFPTIGKKTISIGGTIYKSGEDIYSSIKRADEAVYEAKESGRNKVVIK